MLLKEERQIKQDGVCQVGNQESNAEIDKVWINFATGLRLVSDFYSEKQSH